MLQASTYHPEHGIIVAVPFEQFDGSRFHDPSYVREYRTRMLRCIQEDRPGFGLLFHLPDGPVSIQLSRSNSARYHVQLESGIALSITTSVTGDGIIKQCAKATNHGDRLARLPYSHDMSVNLARASYGQLTEGGIMVLPKSRNILTRTNATTMQVVNPELGAKLLATLTLDDRLLKFGTATEQDVEDTPLTARIMTLLTVPPKSSVQIHARFQLLPFAESGRDQNLGSVRCCDVESRQMNVVQWKHSELLTTFILRRNVDYILANCTIPLGETAVAIIPDHVALPLGWNRDN